MLKSPIKASVLFAVMSLTLAQTAGAKRLHNPHTSLKANVVKPELAAFVTALPMGDAVHGAKLYQSCMGCHSLDENDVGPKHRGVVGRKAGTVPGYTYSPALKGSGLVWTPETLDQWLSGPQKMVPGAKMFFTVKSAQDRADLIAFLAKQK